MKAWNQIAHYAGFDWAEDHHDVIVLDAGGKMVADFRFDHTVNGWAQCGERIAGFLALAIAVETKHGAVIERLLEMGSHIFLAHPQSAKAYRQRKVPSGKKPITWTPGVWPMRSGSLGSFALKISSRASVAAGQ